METNYKAVVYNLEDAQNFFVMNSSGNVKCVREDDEESKVCSTYKEVKVFFED